MQKLSIALFALAGAATGLKTRVTPITKVLTALNAMHDASEKEIQTERINFSAYKQWCEDTTSEKSRLVQEAELRLTELTATAQKNEADAERLAKEIAAHDADVTAWDTDIKEAVAIRENEHVDFVATHKDYSESIDALERAINELKKQNFDRAQASSLLQKLAVTVPKAASRIRVFLQQDPAALSYKAPEAYGYEFQSSGVIDMLEKLLDKFEGERSVLEKEEANAQSAHELLKQDLEAQIKLATESRNAKEGEKSQKQQAAAQAKGDYEETAGTKESNAKYLADLTAQCQTKHQEFETRQKLRAEEIEALNQCIELLESHVKPNAEKHLPGGASFLQVFSGSRARTIQRQVASYLREQADKLHSRVLSALAVKVEDDAFGKVKKMIEELIFRLMEEANQEAQHKGWCDQEIKANELIKTQKTTAVNSLIAEIDELSARIQQLAQEITDLQKALSELEAAVSVATEQRQKEKATNEATIKDAEEASSALAQALVIIKEYYAKAGAPALIAQSPSADAPITWEAPYTGQLGSKGVVDMIEVIQSDFARLESETKADEETAAKAYDQFIKESDLNKLTMTKDVEFKTEKKQNYSGEKELKIQDHDGAQKELDAALAYYEKLKPACIESGDTYEDRVGKRDEEIASLKQALEILSGTPATSFLMKNSRRH